MPLLLLLILAVLPSAFAGLEKIHVQNLNMEYVSPRGAGDVEKINLGLSFLPGPYAIEIEKVDATYVARTPMVDLIWDNPGKFLLSLEKMTSKNVSVNVGVKAHEAKGSYLSFTPAKDGEYRLHNLRAKCAGESVQSRIENRMFEDCRESMLVEMDKLEVPHDFLIMQVIRKLSPDSRVMDQPLKDFYLKSQKGDFFLYFLARYMVTAGLRAWGKISYENDFKTVVPKINLIKFGIFPVTDTVMKSLKESNTNPKIVINPPYIRITL